METVQDRRRIRRVSDERILSAAAEEFAAAGYTGAAMQAIAARASTTKATIYANFGDKASLHEAVIAAEATELRAVLLTAYASVEGQGVREQMRAGVAAIFDFAAARPTGFRLLFGGRTSEGVSDASPAMARTYAEVLAAVRAMIDRHLARVGVTNPSAGELLSSVLVEICRTAATTAVLDSDMDLAVATRVAESLALGALGALDPALLNAL